MNYIFVCLSLFLWILWRCSVTSGLSGCESRTAEDDVIGLIFSQDNFDDGTSKYANDDFQCWKLSTSEGMHIAIEAVEFDLQSADGNGNCLDFVRIYEGDTNDTSELVGTYCGSLFNPYTTPGTEVLVVFSTDDSTRKRGFELKYQSESEGSSVNVAQVVGFTVLAVGVVALGVAIMIFCVITHHNKQRHIHVEHNHPEDAHQNEEHHGEHSEGHHHQHKDHHKHHFKKTGEV